jgi:spermidine/putrescine-binding protein
LSEEKKEEKAISRRKYLGAVGGLAAAAAVGWGLAGYLASKPKAPTIEKTVTLTKTITATPGVTTPAVTPAAPIHLRQIVYWGVQAEPPFQDVIRREANVIVDYEPYAIGTYVSILLTKGREYDIIHNWTAFGKPLYEAEPPIIQPIPAEKIPRWNPKNITEFLINTDEFLKGIDYDTSITKHIKDDIWWKGEYGKRFSCVITDMGLDCMAYNPEFVNVKGGTEGDPDLDSYEAIIDPQWKGKTAICDVPTATIPMWALYLTKNKMMDPPEDICDLKEDEIDKVVDFLIPIKKRGQFKLLWPDFGTAVDACVAREIWVGDLWSGIVMAVRRKMVPFIYMLPKEGGMYWQSGDSITVDVSGDKLEACYKTINARLSGELAPAWAYYGYQFPAYPSEEAKKAMGPEFYGWNFEGKRTYKPISETKWGKMGYPDRIAAALFLPDEYEWSMEPGTPNPKGHKRYTGPMKEYFRSICVYETWLTEGAYYAEAWARFKAA